MENKQLWHLDKRVTIGNLLTSLIVASSMVVWGINIESRVASQDVKIQNNSEKIAEAEKRNGRSQERIYELINKVDEKLDRLIERQRP